MNMITMLGLLTIVYFCSLLLICLYKEHINIKIGNLVFVILDVLFFFCWNYAGYQAGWLDNGFMTLGNISPFIFTLIPFTYIMKDKVKEFAFSAIACLWLGMFIAMYVSPEYAYLFGFNHEANFLYTSEAVCHMLTSLFGIYLIVTGQVRVEIKTPLKAVVFMYLVIGFGVFLNFVFHKSHFGMDPYGDYSIYMIDIFGSFEATFIAYLIGVFLVLLLGMQAGSLVEKISKKQPQKHVMRLRAQPFNAIKSGEKDLELRLNDEKRQRVHVGDVIEFIQTDTQEKLMAEVVGKYPFETFSGLYAAFDKKRLGYQEHEIADPKDMEAYYSPEEISQNGVVAIELKLRKE